MSYLYNVVSCCTSCRPFFWQSNSKEVADIHDVKNYKNMTQFAGNLMEDIGLSYTIEDGAQTAHLCSVFQVVHLSEMLKEWRSRVSHTIFCNMTLIVCILEEDRVCVVKQRNCFIDSLAFTQWDGVMLLCLILVPLYLESVYNYYLWIIKKQLFMSYLISRYQGRQETFILLLLCCCHDDKVIFLVKYPWSWLKSTDKRLLTLTVTSRVKERGKVHSWQ